MKEEVKAALARLYFAAGSHTAPEKGDIALIERELQSGADYEFAYDRAAKVFEAAQKPFGVNVEFTELPRQVEEIFKEVRQFRLDENVLAQAIGNVKEEGDNVIQRAAKIIPKWLAKLSERKTVHEWLNQLGVPRQENGRDLCLLRRIAIFCDMYREAKTVKDALRDPD